MFLRYITVLIFVFITITYSQGNKKLEDEFIKSGEVIGKNKIWRSTVSINWTTDRQSALCERALNDSRQFEGYRLPTIAEKTIVFKVIKHGAVNVTVLKCPTALKKYIYESPRELDCYLILREEPMTREKKDDSIFIEKEICGIGLM